MNEYGTQVDQRLEGAGARPPKQPPVDGGLGRQRGQGERQVGGLDGQPQNEGPGQDRRRVEGREPIERAHCGNPVAATERGGGTHTPTGPRGARP
ncbi:MAG: hypothetical protein WDM88_00525 [Galbitalea sp.]